MPSHPVLFLIEKNQGERRPFLRAVLGGSQAYASGDARREIVDDLKQKSLETKPIKPNDLAYGFIFFRAEAKTARTLRLHLVEKETGKTHAISFNVSQPVDRS